MKNNPLISIIVPVYNVERYLPRCIESILKQTYTNFELILVDDGTPDRSGIICDRYAERDSRIRVIHKENGGVSSARNAGIDAANGEWITFVDSDDWVSDDYLEALLHPLQLESFDLVVGNAAIHRVHVVCTEINEITIDKRNIGDSNIVHLFDQFYFFGSCMKLYSKKKVDNMNLRFPNGVAMAEDSIFVMRYLKECFKIFVTDKVIYHYNLLSISSISNKLPYYEKRKEWDVEYIKAYQEMLLHFEVDARVCETLVYKKTILGFKTVVRSIVRNLSEIEAKEKIKELFVFYESWIGANLYKIQLPEEHPYYKFAVMVKEKNENDIYVSLKNEKRCGLLGWIKQDIKRMLRPFIEKYRDGLVKFKF